MNINEIRMLGTQRPFWIEIGIAHVLDTIHFLLYFSHLNETSLPYLSARRLPYSVHSQKSKSSLQDLTKFLAFERSAQLEPFLIWVRPIYTHFAMKSLKCSSSRWDQSIRSINKYPEIFPIENVPC